MTMMEEMDGKLIIYRLSWQVLLDVCIRPVLYLGFKLTRVRTRLYHSGEDILRGERTIKADCNFLLQSSQFFLK